MQTKHKMQMQKRQLFSETGKQKGIYHNILHYFEFDS